VIKPHTIFTGDNLPILRGMDGASIDLIYLDPPFNSKRTYAAPIGSQAAGAGFKDTWTLADTDIAWWGELAEASPALHRVIDASGAVGGKADKAYCVYMAIRLLEMRRILKPGGSLYLHCDPVMSHSLKLILDAIFGAKNFRNEIVWSYNRFSRHGKNAFPSMHDHLLFYANGDKQVFTALHTEPRDSARYEKGWHTVVDQGVRKLLVYDSEKARKSKLDFKKYDKVVYTKARAPKLGDVWNIPIINPRAKERIGYPTQKPLALLRRIITASSKPGDMVLDPFCGCATACVAAQDQGRNWVGIDLSQRAYELVQQRFRAELGIFNPGIIHRTDIPQRAGPRPSKNIKHTLFGRQQGVCNGCKCAFHFRHFHRDHIIPLSHGGPDSDDNLQLLCGSCNNIKGDRPMDYLRARLREMGVLK